MHHGLRHENSHHEIQLLLQNSRRSGVLMEKERDPLIRIGLGGAGVGNVFAGELKGFDTFLEADVEFLD